MGRYNLMLTIFKTSQDITFSKIRYFHVNMDSTKPIAQILKLLLKLNVSYFIVYRVSELSVA